MKLMGLEITALANHRCDPSPSNQAPTGPSWGQRQWWSSGSVLPLSIAATAPSYECNLTWHLKTIGPADFVLNLGHIWRMAI